MTSGPGIEPGPHCANPAPLGHRHVNQPVVHIDHVHLLKDCEVSGLLIDARDKFESQIVLVFFFHCILTYMYKLGTFV